MKADRSAAAPVFNIQSYCIHDGPGIRVTVFVKGCPLKCLWCQNPESQAPFPQLMTYINKCTGCGACVNACPNGAVTVQNGLSVTDREKCTACGVCVSACPAECREIAGKMTTVEEALEKVLQDKLFLDTSGGGMTISGGEALYHPDFTQNLLMAAHEEGIRTAVETCSFASRDVIDRVFPHVDTALLDVKHMNSEEHRRLTGVPNEQILSNIEHIANDLKVTVWLRVPVIPGYNDSTENIEATARFAAERLGHGTRIHLLPYNKLGESKSENLGRELLLSADTPSDEYMEKLKKICDSYGLDTKIGG